MQIRLYTHAKYYNNSCVSWAVIEFWCPKVAFLERNDVKFLVFF